MRCFRHCHRAIRKRITIGATTPASLGMVLLFDSSISINKIPQKSRVARIAPKLKRETFTNLTLIGTKKKMITTKLGTKNGYIKIL